MFYTSLQKPKSWKGKISTDPEPQKSTQTLCKPEIIIKLLKEAILLLKAKKQNT